MANFPPQVQRVIDNGYSFDLGDYISKGFKIIQKNLGLFIAFILVFIVISVVLSVIPVIGQLASSLIVSPCLLAGFLIAAKKSDDNQPLEFGDFFKGFDFLKPLLVTILIQAAIMIAVMIPFGLAFYVGGDMNALEAGDPSGIPFWSFILLLPLIYLAVAWGMTSFLIVFHKMSAWDALEASRQIITKQWFMFFLFGIVVGIIVMLGMVALGVGILFTLPAGMAMQFAAYRDIVGIPGHSEEMSISDHLVD